VQLVSLEAKLRELGLGMVPPLDVRVPRVAPSEPAFCSEAGWLERVTSMVREGLRSSDGNDRERTMPVAFMRCRGGGKTRVAQSVRAASPEVAVVCVPFTDVREWEHADPVHALCRRIAFAALFADAGTAEPTAGLYERFANTLVSAEDVTSWLGGRPRLLLIDNLDSLVATKKTERLGTVSQITLLGDSRVLLCLHVAERVRVWQRSHVSHGRGGLAHVADSPAAARWVGGGGAREASVRRHYCNPVHGSGPSAGLDCAMPRATRPDRAGRSQAARVE
jgi:hypothetical protein